MRIFCLLSFFFFNLSLNAQNENALDEIERQFELCEKYQGSNSQKRIYHARKALRIAEKNDKKKERGEALGEIGNYFLRESQTDSSFFYYSKALRQFKQINDRSGRAVILMHLSELAEMKGDLIKSFGLLMTADSLFKLENQPQRRVETSVAISTLLSRQREFDKALIYLRHAEEIVDNDPEKKGIIYNNMVGCYAQLGDFENSYKYAKKAIELAKELNNPLALAHARNNLASVIFNEKGATDEVIRLLTQTLKGYESIGDEMGIIRSYNSLGTAYRLKKEFSLAENHLLLAAQLCLKIDDYSLIMANKRELHKFYSETENWETALMYYREFKEMEDSINSLEKTKIIQDLQTKYDTEELKRENELAKVNEQLSKEKALKSRNTSILIFAIGLFLILTLTFIYFQYRQRKKKELVELELEAAQERLAFEKQNRLSELKALQSQMNPHFVFNSLNSIQDLILQNDRKNSMHYLGKFSELTRKILEQSNHEFISVADELELIELYANLEKLRFGDDLTFETINRLESIECEELMLPSMFVQPYIENAFKHGLIHKKGTKSLKVLFEKEADALICTIEDNGVGREKVNEIDRRRKKAHLNFSSKANLQRVDLLNQQKGNNIHLEVIDKMENTIPQGTIIKIYLDLAINKET